MIQSAQQAGFDDGAPPAGLRSRPHRTWAGPPDVARLTMTLTSLLVHCGRAACA